MVGWWRRERPARPENWEAILDRRSALWARLNAGERRRLGELVEHLITTKRWEAARGLELTPDVLTVVSGHAGVLLLGLDERYYDEVGTIVVRRQALRRPPPVPTWGPVAGVVDGTPSVVDGEAHHGEGPVMVNWSAARREALRPAGGHDVVLHEFAHKLDMLDGVIDGTPPFEDESLTARWIEVATREYDAVRAAEPGSLRAYAGTNPGEFFAVATEVFFTRPVRLADQHAELYDLLRAFYRQDPAAREAAFCT